MGDGYWSAATHAAVTGAKIASGTSFGYDATAKRTGVYKAHDSVDPKRLNKAGLNIREARDSADHPNSKAMVIALDGTGSMGTIPRELQSKLKRVYSLTVDKGIKDVQIAYSVYGDAANNDRVPLQISQFESDNRGDDALDNLFIEGGGGGNNGETSQLLFYYLAYHTAIDSFEKRGQKGKVYMIADEKQVPITAAHVREHIGDEQPLGDLSFEALAAAVTKMWDVTVLLIDNYSARVQGSQEFYSNLFGPRNVVLVQDVSSIPDMIAGLYAFDMGRDAASVTADLATAAGKEVALRVGDALAKRGASSGTLR